MICKVTWWKALDKEDHTNYGCLFLGLRHLQGNTDDKFLCMLELQQHHIPLQHAVLSLPGSSYHIQWQTCTRFPLQVPSQGKSAILAQLLVEFAGRVWTFRLSSMISFKILGSMLMKFQWIDVLQLLSFTSLLIKMIPTWKEFNNTFLWMWQSCTVPCAHDRLEFICIQYHSVPS